ncbi:hypothetical protein, partial [Staphylococcus pseudintermedius]|uniref:hypothetical protein n=1 Tax=Staphylococcus pseudintermedius TaxID=283734 RepID=UPI0036F22A29
MSEFPIPCSIVYKNSFENKRLVHSPYILSISLSLKKEKLREAVDKSVSTTRSKLKVEDDTKYRVTSSTRNVYKYQLHIW